MQRKLYHIFIIFIFMQNILFAIQVASVPFKNIHQYAITNEQPENNIDLSINELSILIETIQRIKTSYVDQINEHTLIQDAIKGIMENLDDHSVFLPPNDFQKIQESISGKFAGIGVEVNFQNNKITIVKTLPHSPASNSGITPGDQIIKIENKSIAKLDPMQITELMRGTPGSKMNMTIIKKNNQHPTKITITRDIINIDSVESHLADKQYGYVKIEQFQNSTAEELKDIISNFNKQHIKGLLIDLRDNPGGLLESAVQIADFFLSKGIIVSTHGRTSGSNTIFNAHKQSISKLPIVVLINHQSASAAEILTGALQDNNRAIIVGEKSYGKGSVQSILMLSSSQKPTGLKLTTARYYTPKGNSIQSIGITPDIKIVAKSNNTSAKKDLQLNKAMDILKSAIAGTLKIKSSIAKH